MFTSTCVNTQGKEREISIWKCQMWLRALKWDRAGLRSKGSADLESVSHCLFCLGVTLGPHGLKIYWEPQKHIWVSHFTDFTFLLHSCRIAPKEQHQFPPVPFRPCSKTWSLWQRRFMHSNKLCPAIWKSSFLCTCMHFKRKSTRGSKTRLNHICLGLNYIVCRVQSCFLSSKKTHPAVFYLKFLPLSKKCFHWPTHVISRSWAS